MPESEAKFTIRPPPACRIGPKAARQQRNVPVRLMRSVSSHVCDVVASIGTRWRMAAAQTNAVAEPTRSAMATSRLTSSPSPTSAAATVAAPPFLWIVSLTFSSCDSVRAARTTWAPARAMASAVARPIPRPAPVTIATRPSSHPGASGMGPDVRFSPHCLVQAFVSGKAGVKAEVFHGVLPASLALDRTDPQQCPCPGGNVVRRDQEAGATVHHDLRQSAATVGNHWGPRSLRLCGDHAKRLVPLGRTEDGRRAGHDPPKIRSDKPAMNRDAGLARV